MRNRFLWLSGLLALAVGCAHQAASPAGALENAAREASSADASARALSLAGFHALLIEGDSKKAQSRFEAAAAKNARDPYGLYGRMLLENRTAHPERVLATALELCEAAPSHPLSTVAARYVFEIAGVSSALDDQILKALSRLGSASQGEAAHLIRSAAATIYGQRGEFQPQAAVLAEMGVPEELTLVGPFSPHHLLGFDDAIGPEQTGSLPAGMHGPFGELKPRFIRAADGRMSLANEAPVGDIYVLAVDLEAPVGAVHVLRSVASVPHKVYLDGTLLYQRRNFARFEPTVAAAGVELSKGRHRLLVKLAKEDRASAMSLSLMRADGKPANLKFARAQGDPPTWAGANSSPVRLVYPGAASLAAALQGESGEVLSDFIAARDGMVRDRDGAKRLVARLSQISHAPAVSGLSAEVALGDRTVSSRVARGRATRELEATTARDLSDASALLSRASLALEDGRLAEASETIKQARDAHRSIGYPIPMMQARIELSLGLDAQADQSALEALSIQPGLCEALSLRYELARRRGDVELGEKLLGAHQACPGWHNHAAEHAKARGEVARAAGLYEELVARDPANLAHSLALSHIYLSERQFDEAASRLESLRELWPRNTTILKYLADVYDFWGKSDQALKTRELALELDGGDLTLRRTVERRRTGKEVLADQAIDGKRAIAEYEAQHGTEDAMAAYVLDAAAVRAYPDGSTVDRIHIVEKALDQSGISELAEVNMPSGAQMLSIRTIKPDGTVLEPEAIEGKDSLSLPGVQVGDYVEYEYLQAHPSQGPARPGFTLASFYFQVARQPNNWSTYTVLAPKGTGLGVDAHNMTAPGPQPRGDEEVFFHEEKHVPPFIPEPDGPPSPNEFLPFVSVGAGARGNEVLIAQYADHYLERGQLNFEIEQFAKEAAQGKTGMEAARALYSAVMQRLSGGDAGLGQSASSSVAQDRGSRLWALKAGLEAIGIPARVVAVRTFGLDPTPYRFPVESWNPYFCVYAKLADGNELWLDPAVRFAPFGELPEQALGREAYLLPELGRPVQTVKTPAARNTGGKEIRLKLKLGPDGKMTGIGDETYSGFEAAQLAEALEALTPQQRDQALQGALSRYFGGADLSELKIDAKQQVGAPLSVRYVFTVPRFARVEDNGKLVLGALTFPSYLGRRFVQVGSRRTPLYVGSAEQNHTVTTLELPPGYLVSQPIPEIKTAGKFGQFVRRERQEKNQLRVEENFRLEMARIPVAQYDEFARFAGEVDLVQARDLVVEKP
jgi:tetratricopeptide (TPR) repeat protein